jgi:hypothetical protein
MRDRRNVRLHFVGHADSQPLSGALTQVYGDNSGLSRERAGEVAEFFKLALGLPPEAISFEWAGDTQPIASNATAAGRAQNRRVEVEVCTKPVEAFVTRKCSLLGLRSRSEESDRADALQEVARRRARNRNPVAPRTTRTRRSMSPRTSRQVRQAWITCSKQNVHVRFIGFSDDAPLTAATRTSMAISRRSKARAHRVAPAVRTHSTCRRNRRGDGRVRCCHWLERDRAGPRTESARRGRILV